MNKVLSIAQLLVDLRAEHSNLLGKDPVMITLADLQERVSKNEELDSTRP